jgi:hypothetical protein
MNTSFLRQLETAISTETHMLDWVTIEIEQSEDCDATLSIRSFGQTTYLKITEWWWKENEQSLLFITWDICADLFDKPSFESIWDNISSDYYYNTEYNITKSSNNRTVNIFQDKIVNLIKIADFINKGIATGLENNNKWKTIQVKEKTSNSKIWWSTIPLQMPQWLTSNTARFYTDHYLKKVSNYINTRIENINTGKTKLV